jgi:trans-2,3-dihydro-3-hydroxyanthranilate isomerase
MARGRSWRYLHLDVFTDEPFTGNQLAVFPDAGDLETELMQRIALEMAFSESTFVFPAEHPGTDCRVRIFTPRSELPMAGHPTIGTTFALAHEHRISKERQSITLGLGVGPTPVSLEWNGDRLQFAWMTQPLPEFGAIIDDIAGIAASLRVTHSDIRNANLPVQVASCGVSFLYVPLVSRAAVNDAELDRDALVRVCRTAGIDELPIFLFSVETSDDATVFSRMFAPIIGVSEDPASGAASGPLGAYLVRHGAVRPDQASHMISLQGVKMGRPSRIHISIGARDGRITHVRVGGQAVLVGEGSLRLD